MAQCNNTTCEIRKIRKNGSQFVTDVRSMVSIMTRKVQQPMQINHYDNQDDDDDGHEVRIFWNQRFQILSDGTEDARSMRIICALNSNVMGNEYYYLV